MNARMMERRIAAGPQRTARLSGTQAFPLKNDAEALPLTVIGKDILELR
ncbi:hypothetical protein [Mesorhizobium sp.]|nr:hypothetical protein [Mesorhizobium sp.]